MSAVNQPEVAATPAVVTAGVVPYLAVAGAHNALDWYASALGARLRGEPMVMPDGRIGHAEMDVFGGAIMLSEEFPEIGVNAPRPDEGTSVTLHAEVTSVDNVLERALAAGAALLRPAADYPYGRNAVLRDPFGHRWLLSSFPVPLSRSDDPAAHAPGTRQGDVAYISFEVPDLRLAMQFYEAVLGWTFDPGNSEQGRQVHGTRLGLWGGQPHGDLVICWHVHDISAAAARVIAAGGTATSPDPRPYGLIADCVDDQGTRFYLFQPPPDEPVAELETPNQPPGSRQGDLGYLTLEVQDSTHTRAFYGAVLGWSFSPGHVEDGWEVQGITPMTGLHGGHPRATAVPMFIADDIRAAVLRVRSAGGTASEPLQQHYGLMADCTDNQGTRFYLWQP